MERDRLRAAIDAGPFDAVMVSSQENTFYATGALILTQREIPLRLALTLWPRGGEPAFVVCGIEESLVRRQSWIGDVRPYVEFAESPVAMIAAAVQEHGLARGHIGVEMDHLMARYWDELRAALPDATFDDAGPLLAAVRVVKTPGEVARLQTAARALERAIAHAYTTARPGCTEKWLADTMATALLAEGADEVKALVLSSGPRSVQSHATPDGTTPIPVGATIRVDFVGVFGGYLADLARMACIGEPSATQRGYYDAPAGDRVGDDRRLPPRCDCRGGLRGGQRRDMRACSASTRASRISATASASACTRSRSSTPRTGQYWRPAWSSASSRRMWTRPSAASTSRTPSSSPMARPAFSPMPPRRSGWSSLREAA